MEELKRKAELLLEQCESVVLTSIDENGFPRPVPMSKVKADGISTIWFATAGMSLLSMNAYLFRSSGYENVELLEECDLLKISNETLDGLFEKEVELANWGRRMSDRIILRMERLFVERYFLTAAERYRLLVEREPEILQKAPLRDIASYLGISQVSLSRIRSGVQ